MVTFLVPETDSLTNIALFSPSEGGPAVHFARAMLGLEVNDPKLVLRSAMSQSSTIQTEVESAAHLKPDNINEEVDKPLNITVSDLTGRQICKIRPDEDLSNNISTGGIYFLKTKYASGKEVNKKAFINKK